MTNRNPAGGGEKTTNTLFIIPRHWLRGNPVKREGRMRTLPTANQDNSHVRKASIGIVAIRQWHRDGSTTQSAPKVSLQIPRSYRERLAQITARQFERGHEDSGPFGIWSMIGYPFMWLLLKIGSHDVRGVEGGR